MIDRDEVADLAPLLRRAVTLDPSGLARFRRAGDRISVLVRLPFGVLAARTIVLDEPVPPDGYDTTVRSADLLAWLDGERPDPPPARDADWRSAVPPDTGWQRIDTVPDTEIRPLVRRGALALKEAELPAGSEAAEALLDSVVLTVSGGEQEVPIRLRTISALTRLGFVPKGSYVAVDLAGRWVRIAAAYGSVYAERPGLGLTLR